MMMGFLRRGALGAFITIFGCAGQPVDFDPPSVALISFRVAPSTGIAPQFEIGLRIVNPNSSALKLTGVAYTVDLEDRRILAGAANDLPVIDPYSSGDVILTATVDLLSGMRLIADLVRQPHDLFSYELNAKLDFGNLQRAILISERGDINLSGIHSR